MKKKRIMLAAVLLIALVIASFRWELHLVADDAREDVLLWNSREAYLFVGWGRSGYRFTCAEYLFSHIPAYFGIPRTVDANRLSILVFRITPTAIERYVADPYQMDRGFLAYVPRGNTIYAYHGIAILWTWAGTDFETLTVKEQRKLAIDASLFSSREDYTGVDGWSLRRSLTRLAPEFKIELQGKPVTFFTKQNNSGKELSLELRLPGGTSQKLLHVKHSFHFVSKSEYDYMFKRP